MDALMYKSMYEVQNKHWWFVAKKKIIKSLIRQYLIFDKNNTLEILDAGCGPGLMLNELQNFGSTSGMDFSEDAIQFSGQHFSGPLKRGNLPSEVPYSDNTFDLLLALDVVEHIDDDLGALKALQKVIKPNGMAILTVPAFMFLWSEHDEINHHKRRYTLQEFKSKIESSGFQIEKISYYNTFLFPLVCVARFLGKLINRSADSDVELPNSFVNECLYRIFSLESFFLKYMNFPFGVSVLAVVRKK